MDDRRCTPTATHSFQLPIVKFKPTCGNDGVPSLESRLPVGSITLFIVHQLTGVVPCMRTTLNPKLNVLVNGGILTDSPQNTVHMSFPEVLRSVQNSPCFCLFV